MAPTRNVEWFLFVRTRNPQSSKRLAIQFSETDPVEGPPLGAGSSCLGSTSSSRECAYKGYWPVCQRCLNFFPPPCRHLPKFPYLLGFGESPRPAGRPSAFLATLPTTFRRGCVLIRATGRAVNADRTVFCPRAAAFPTPCHPSGFWSNKSPSPRWFRPGNPVTLRWLPCWSA